jgi:flavorubredoxin
MFINISILLAQPTSFEDIKALQEGTFYTFASKKTKIKTLNLFGCGTWYGNNWGKYPEFLNGLLAAMAKTPLRESLKTIGVGSCEVNEEQVKEMVERLGFTNISVIKDKS